MFKSFFAQQQQLAYEEIEEEGESQEEPTQPGKFTVEPDPPVPWDAEGNLIRYYLTIGGGPFYTDTTAAWQTHLPPPFYPNFPFYGIIRKGSILLPYQAIPKVAGDLMKTLINRITIYAEGVNGYYYKTGLQTGAVACFNLSSIELATYGTTTSTEATHVHATYTLEEDQIFEIPVKMTVLTLQIAYDGGVLQMPFQNPQIPIMLDLSSRRERQVLKIRKEEIEIDF